jgi:hypothetical protein
LRAGLIASWLNCERMATATEHGPGKWGLGGGGCLGVVDGRRLIWRCPTASEGEGRNGNQIATNRRRRGRWGRKKHLRWHLVDLAPNTQRDERAERAERESEAEGENQIERPADEIATNRRRPGRWGRKKHLRWHLVDLAPKSETSALISSFERESESEGGTGNQTERHGDEIATREREEGSTCAGTWC